MLMSNVIRKYKDRKFMITYKDNKYIGYVEIKKGDYLYNPLKDIHNYISTDGISVDNEVFGISIKINTYTNITFENVQKLCLKTINEIEKANLLFLNNKTHDKYEIINKFNYLIDKHIEKYPSTKRGKISFNVSKVGEIEIFTLLQNIDNDFVIKSFILTIDIKNDDILNYKITKSKY